MALKKSDLYSSLWKSCDELRGGMDAVAVQGLHPDAAVREVRLGQGQGRPEQPDRRSRGRLVRRHGRRSRATRRSATRSTRSSASSPRPTTCRRSSTRPTSTTRRSSARARRCRTGSPSWSTIFDDLDFRGSPRRGRRPARRRLRVPDAALRHRVRQAQGPVLHAGRGLADPGQGRRHRRRHTPGPDRLRPDLRLRLAAAQGRRRGAARHHDLRPGEGQRHLGAVQDEHDPARQRGSPTSARATRSPARSSPRATSSRPSTSSS